MKIISAVVTALAISAGGSLSIANASSDDAKLDQMEQLVEQLQARIEALEEIKPTFTSFMPDFSERFHVLHRAGEAKDWAVAGHELSEMKRMASISKGYDAKNAQLLEGMLTPSFNALSEAVENGDSEEFNTAMINTIKTCNACHTASGSPFIKVTLDTIDAISIRHPHDLGASEQMGGHGHGEAAAGGHDEAPGAEAGHDETETAEAGHDEAPEAEAGHDEAPEKMMKKGHDDAPGTAPHND